MSVYTDTDSHWVRISALLLERFATIVLAILLYRLHIRMTKFRVSDFQAEWVSLEKWLLEQKVWILFNIFLLFVAFILSLVDEILRLSQPED